MDFEILKTDLDLLFEAVRARLAVVPQIAALSATVLVIATFNDKLVTVTRPFLIALTILLVLIPLSLFIYLLEVHLSIIKSGKAVEKITGKKMSDLLPRPTIGIKIFSWVCGYYPWIATSLLSLVILYVIVIIWQKFI